MSHGQSHRRSVAERASPELFRAALDASPHGVELRTGERVLYQNAAWDRLRTLGQESPDAGSNEIPQREIKSAQYQFDFSGMPVEVRVAADITDRKRLEMQLHEAQRLESLGRWVGSVVHDFKNLLTAVTLYSDLVAQTIPPESAGNRYNEEVRHAVRRGAELASQLLAFAREERSNRCVLSLNTLLRGMSDVLQRMICEDVELVFSLSYAPCNITLEPMQVQQIVFNLALNSRDAMPNGGRLELKTYEVEEGDVSGQMPSGWVGLEVIDNGCGMTDDVRQRIFEPFFTTKANGKGTGLGLTTVRSIVQENGGSTSVQSEAGKGTRVSIRLPRASSAVIKEQVAAISEEPSGSETILLVEDEPIVRTSMSQVLTQCGYRVLEAANGIEALKIFAGAGGDVDLVISDIVLPGISGREVVRRLRAECPRLRALFISGYGEPLPGGGLDSSVVEKPFNWQSLAAKVRRVLESEDPEVAQGS